MDERWSGGTFNLLRDVTILFSTCCFRECWLSDKFTPCFSIQTLLKYFISVQMTAPSQQPLLKITKALPALVPFSLSRNDNSSCHVGSIVGVLRPFSEDYLFKSLGRKLSSRCERQLLSSDGHHPPFCLFYDVYGLIFLKINTL